MFPFISVHISIAHLLCTSNQNSCQPLCVSLDLKTVVTSFTDSSQVVAIPSDIFQLLLTLSHYSCWPSILYNHIFPSLHAVSALTVHYESQCIPTPAAWFAHQLPVWFHKLCVVGTYVIEIALPLLFFSPLRSHRLLAFYGQVKIYLLWRHWRQFLT